MEDKEKLIKCPFCNSESGYYRIAYMKGKGAFHYEFDGASADNTNLHDALEYREIKKAFCADCHKELPFKKLNIIEESNNS